VEEKCNIFDFLRFILKEPKICPVVKLRFPPKADKSKAIDNYWGKQKI
jgi:hypothetical protein